MMVALNGTTTLPENGHEKIRTTPSPLKPLRHSDKNIKLLIRMDSSKSCYLLLTRTE
jgi:hypothetical protein